MTKGMANKSTGEKHESSTAYSAFELFAPQRRNPAILITLLQCVSESRGAGADTDAGLGAGADTAKDVVTSGRVCAGPVNAVTGGFGSVAALRAFRNSLAWNEKNLAIAR